MTKQNTLLLRALPISILLAILHVGCHAHVMGVVKDVSSRPIEAEDGKICCVSSATDCHEARTGKDGRLEFTVDLDDRFQAGCRKEFRSAKILSGLPCEIKYSGPDQEHIEVVADCGPDQIAAQSPDPGPGQPISRSPASAPAPAP